MIRDLKWLTVKKRRRGIPIEDFVMGWRLRVGGDRLTDLRVLREEAVTRELCYGLEVPAATTAGERLRTFALGHLYQLERINRRAARTVLERLGGSGPLRRYSRPYSTPRRPVVRVAVPAAVGQLLPAAGR